MVCNVLAASAALTIAFSPAQNPLADGERIGLTIPGPRIAAVGDVDGDGHSDVVIADAIDVFVIRGTASGWFHVPEHMFEAPALPVRLQIEDMDGDGDGEIFVVESAGPTSMWSSVGGGGYGRIRRLTDTRNPWIADIDGDGTVDIVSPAVGIGFSWYRGLPGLDFDAPVPLLDTGELGSRVRAVDLEGNGDLDLVATATSGAYRGLWAFENTGTIPFDLSLAVNVDAQTPQLGEVVQILPFDADGDGDQDLVTKWTPSGEGAQYIENLGGGNYASAALVVPDGERPVQIADANADGIPDIVMATVESDGEALGYALGDGGGGFLALLEFGRPMVPGWAVGFTDIVPGGGAEVLSINEDDGIELHSWGGSGFDAPRQLQHDIREWSVGQRSGDLVGLTDLPRSVIRRRLQANGKHGPTELVSGLGISGSTTERAATIGDLDGDGIEDVLFSSDTSVISQSLVSVRYGLDTGALGPRVDLFTALSHDFIELVDVDNDGELDVVTGGTFGFIPVPISVARSQGGGAFGAPVVLSIESPYFRKPWFLDLDRDGAIDIVLRSPVGLEWFRGRGDGTFEPIATAYSFALPPGANELTDINGDGLLDFVADATTTTQLVWAAGIGGGQFGPFAPLLADAPYESFCFVDLDRDGLDDLVAVRDGSVLVTRRRLGRTFFDTEFVVPVPLDGPVQALRNVITADYDNDGDVDVVCRASVQGVSDSQWIVARNLTLADVGTTYCAFAQPNATGARGLLSAYGASDLMQGALQLRASALPPDAAGYFLTSLAQDLVTSVPNSVGTLCLGGSIGRFVGPGQIGVTDAGGCLTLDLDLGALPTAGTSLVSAQSGETRFFQAWFRDSAGGQATSNFTTGLAVTFL